MVDALVTYAVNTHNGMSPVNSRCEQHSFRQLVSLLRQIAHREVKQVFESDIMQYFPLQG
jgi:hypothetical protein